MNTDYSLQLRQTLATEAMAAKEGVGTASRLVSVNPTGGEAGTGNATKTFASPCLELEVYNNSETNTISFTCGTFTKTLLPKQGWYGPLSSFTTVTVTAPAGSPWTVNGQALEVA